MEKNNNIGMLYVVLVALPLFMASASANGASSQTPLTSTTHSVTADFNLTHPIIAANLLSYSGKELLALGIDEYQQRWLAIYHFEPSSKQYVQSLKYQLPSEINAFDVSLATDEQGRVNPTSHGQQHLYFLTSEQLYRFAPMDKVSPLQHVADIHSMSLKQRAEFISEVDFMRDLNGDKREDIIIADFSQSHIFIAQADGSYIEQSLPIKPYVRLYQDGARYTQATVYGADINLDGRIDLVKMGEGELEVYEQLTSGMFNPIAKYQSLHLAISGQDWWDRRDAYGESLDQSSLVYRKVEQLTDINNDGLVDLVVRYTKSSGVLDRVNDYEIYLGRKTLNALNTGGKLASLNAVVLKSRGSHLSFGKKPSSVIRAEGTLTGLEFVDIDMDNKVEVLVSGFDIGLSQIVGALISGSIDQDVHLFKMDQHSRFAVEPSVSKEVELSFSLTSGQSGSPVIKLADFNGDGLKDLLLSDGEQTLEIFLGKPGGDLFASNSLEFEITLPQEGDMVICADLNGDGKSDLLISYGRQDDKALQQVFHVVLAE